MAYMNPPYTLYFLLKKENSYNNISWVSYIKLKYVCPDYIDNQYLDQVRSILRLNVILFWFLCLMAYHPLWVI